MKTKRTSLIVAGMILAVMSSQVMAQPWGGGPGRRQGFGRGQGMGMGSYGPGFMRQGMGPGGRQAGSGVWRPLGAGQVGQGAWCPLGLRQFGLNGQFGCRLGLTDDQVREIGGILEKARSKTMAAIKEVLTEEQSRQLEQIWERAAQSGRRMRGPAFQDGSAGRRFQQGAGQGPMGPRGQRPLGQPFAGGRGAGQGPRLQRGMNPPDVAAEPPAGAPDANPGQLWNRGMPPIEQMFDRADTNKDGALTREELRAFRGALGAGPGRQRQ